MILENLSKNKSVIANCKRQRGEEVVQQDLAITPAQMYDMVQAGKPVGASILSPDYFDDGDHDTNMHVPLDRQRGVDIVEMWNAERKFVKDSYKFNKKQKQKNADFQQKGGE